MKSKVFLAVTLAAEQPVSELQWLNDDGIIFVDKSANLTYAGCISNSPHTSVILHNNIMSAALSSDEKKLAVSGSNGAYVYTLRNSVSREFHQR